MRNDFAHRTLDGAIVEIGLFDGRHEAISRAIVEWFDDSLRVVRRIDARRLVYIDSVWTAVSAEERRFSPSGEMSYMQHDTLQVTEIQDTPEDFGSRSKSAAEMNIFQLHDHIERVRIAGGNPRWISWSSGSPSSFPSVPLSWYWWAPPCNEQSQERRRSQHRTGCPPWLHILFPGQVRSDPGPQGGNSPDHRRGASTAGLHHSWYLALQKGWPELTPAAIANRPVF